MTTKSILAAKTLVTGGDVDYSGFLYQNISFPSKNWTKRFVILLSETIYIYSKKSSKQPKVILPLNIFNLEIKDHEDKSTYWIFHLEPKPGNENILPLILGARSSSERDAFVSIFRRIVVGMSNNYFSNINKSFNDQGSRNSNSFDRKNSVSIPYLINYYEPLPPTVANDENQSNFNEEYSDFTDHQFQNTSSKSHTELTNEMSFPGNDIQNCVSDEYDINSAQIFQNDIQGYTSEENNRSFLNPKENLTFHTSDSNSKIESYNEEPDSDDCIYYDEPSANLENILFYGNSIDAHKEFFKNFQIGSYLIRQNDDRQVLTVQCEKQVVKYILETDQLTNKVHIKHQNRTFDNLLELIAYYRENDIPHEKIKLTIPYKLVDKTL